MIAASEAKRNCARATEHGEEAWSMSCERMDENWLQGATEQSGHETVKLS
ncbi:MAG: hypothetical protein LT102_10780 [Burkholderiaceae bacterium]|nr:hypothetical protein [Burkholderiaceae bacterium]